MDVDLLLPLLITTIVAMGGWFVVHRLSQNRERTNKRRDMRVQYLIDAWNILENASNRTDNLHINDLEKAIASIQLFGSRKQIDLALKFADEFSKERSASLDKLLEDLRFDLREELGLEPISKNIHSLRIINKPEQKITQKFLK